MSSDYDVFISYRRDGGAETALYLRHVLHERGYRVFFDMEALRSGPFDTRLYSVIEGCKDVIVVLSPGCLERCRNEGDWFRLEITHALKCGKNIVPFSMRQFNFDEMALLPEDIAALKQHNGVSASYEYNEATLAKLAGFLKSRPNTIQVRKEKRYRMFITSVAICLVTLIVGFSYTHRSTSARLVTESRNTSPQATEEEAQMPRQQNEIAPGTVKFFAGFEMVWCPPGTFTMGDRESTIGENSVPHEVTLSNGFWMGKYEVTQKQWSSVMGENPSHFRGDTLPVESVSWKDSQEFISRLNDRTDGKFRLPSEAEWEYACRAGTTTSFAFGESISSLDQSNFSGTLGVYTNPNDTQKVRQDRACTTEVGIFPANAWGIHDMHGNVWEWCSDRMTFNDKAETTDPKGSGWSIKQWIMEDIWFNQKRVLRGGGWEMDASSCTSFSRLGGNVHARDNTNGLRLVWCD